MFSILAVVLGTLISSSQLVPIELTAAPSTSEKTLTAFSGTTKTLSTKQKSEIGALLVNNAGATAVVCTGLITKNTSQSLVSRTKSRAQAACDYAKAQKPLLAASIAMKSVTKKSSVGKVTVSLVLPPPVLPQPPSITLDNLDPIRTKVVANQIVENELKNKVLVEENILQIRKGPSLSVEDLKGPKQSVLNAIGLFYSIYKPTVVNTTWFTGADADWVDQAIEDAGASSRATPTRELYSSWIRSVRNCNMGNAGLGSKGPYFNQCIKSSSPPSHDFETASHEYFHVVQYEVSGYRLPHWFMEGGATFVGIHVGGQTYGDFLTARSTVINRWRNGLDAGLLQAFRSKDLAYVEERMKLLEQPQVESAIQTSGYALGMLTYEALVAAQGWQAFLAHLQDNKTLGFAQSLEKNFGVTSSALYKKVAPYIVSQLGPAN